MKKNRGQKSHASVPLIQQSGALPLGYSMQPAAGSNNHVGRYPVKNAMIHRNLNLSYAM